MSVRRHAHRSSPRATSPMATSPTAVRVASRLAVLVIAAAAAAIQPAAAQQKPAPAAAKAPPPPAAASEARRDIEQAERYLNSFRRLQSHFVQVAPDGATSEGTFYLSRPGRLRVEYDPPADQLIVANGSQLIHYDRKLDQPSYIPLSQTPAGLLTRETFDFEDPLLEFGGYERDAGAFSITVRDAKNPDLGSLSLIFTDNPVALRQWVVTDPQRGVTRVTLSDVRLDPTLSRDLFVFNRFDRSNK